MKKVFISYSSKDREAVVELKGALERKKKYQIWFDQVNISPGDYYARNIAEALSVIDVFILVVSQNSVGNRKSQISGSDEVSRELKLAEDNGALIIPVKIDDNWIDDTSHSEFKYLLSRSQWLEASDCQTQSDYDRVSDKIQEAVEKGNFKFSFEHTLDEIEAYLKNGAFSKADALVRTTVFPNKARERLIILNGIIELKKQPIRKAKKEAVDSLVVQLQGISDKSLLPFSLYFRGVLSQFFYKRNALSDPTGGMLLLKQKAKTAGRLTAKHALIIEHILPDNSGFALSWRY